MDNSIVELVVIVMAGAVGLLFAADIGKIAKNAWKKPWVRVIAPPFLASLLVVANEQKIIHLFEAITFFLDGLFERLKDLLGFLPMASFLSHVLVIFVVSIIPPLLVEGVYRYNKQKFKGFVVVYLYAWVLLACLSLLEPFHLRV